MTPILLRSKHNPVRIYHGILNESGTMYQYGSADACGRISRVLRGEEQPSYSEAIGHFNSVSWEMIRLTRID